MARAFAGKPEHERWVVILNEFTDTGIDVLTVAGQARGEFDVRLVPGGCLCCASELDFTRTLRELVRGPRPARLFVEPSGIGHPAAIVEELLTHQSHGSVRLESIVCLVDPGRLHAVREPGVARDQAEVADALVLAKADLATDATRAEFAALAGDFYPPKRWVGECAHGDLPPPALAPPGPRAPFAVLPPRPTDHAPEHATAVGEGSAAASAEAPGPALALPGIGAERRIARHVGREAGAWVFERRVGFSRPALVRTLERDARLAPVERLKGVFRTGSEHWALVQVADGRVSVAESSWRRDSRVEVLLRPGARADWPAWDALWESVTDVATPR
ncbi:MAG: CobW family GTP-binding protein [Pseudomonadota bacterium]